MTAGPVEIEWQFDALDLRPVERFVSGGTVAVTSGGAETVLTLAPLAAQRLQDSYLDTTDWRVGRSGLVLRVRQKRGKHEATVKDLSPAEDGLRRRLEMTESLAGGTFSPSATGGSVSQCVWSLVGDRSLEIVFDVSTRRRPFEIRAGDEVIGELALDDTTIDVGPGQAPLRLRRVEVEMAVPEGGPEPVTEAFVEKLRRECGLQPASLSKFEVGLLALGVEIPAGATFGPTQLPERATVGDVAYVAVRRALAAMLAHEPGTRIGSDAEELHQMRVATRHMRAVLGIFAPAFPVRAQQLRNEIGWVAGVLGKVRDLDVQLEQLHGWIAEAPTSDAAALAELGEVLGAHRDEARAELLIALDSPRYERLVGALGATLRSGPSSRLAGARAAAPEVVDAIVALQARAAKAARRAKRSGVPADYHQLRIRCKRLRYALEYVSEVFEGKVATFRKQIVTLQTLLGDLQDFEVASARLRAMAGADGSGHESAADLKPGAIFVMGRLSERYDERERSLLARLPGEMGLVKGSEWQQLLAYMHERREEVRSTPATPVATVRRATSAPTTPTTGVAPAARRGRPAPSTPAARRTPTTRRTATGTAPTAARTRRTGARAAPPAPARRASTSRATSQPAASRPTRRRSTPGA